MRVIIVIGCLVAAVRAQGCSQSESFYPKEQYQCPQDCGRNEKNGCIQCTCGGQVVPAEPISCFPDNEYLCPPFCGTNPEIVDEFGCVSCTCGALPILKCPPLTDQECPGYCSRSTDEGGCEFCDCPNECPQVRQWYPADYQCPQDCGRQQAGPCIQCTCGGDVVEAAPPSCFSPSGYQCPPEPFCGTSVDRFGCLSCTCGDQPDQKPF